MLSVWAASAPAANPVILVLGDSLSAAYGIDPNQGWVALLRQRLERTGYRYEVINASVSGDTTRGGLARLSAALTQHRPRIVIVELGGNDGLRGLSLADMRANLSGIIERGRASGARVLLAGVRLPPNYGEAYTQKFHEVYRELARTYRVPLVPFLLDGIGGRQELMQSDGIHPGPGAQARMLENIWPHLLPLLQ